MRVVTWRWAHGFHNVFLDQLRDTQLPVAGLSSVRINYTYLFQSYTEGVWRMTVAFMKAIGPSMLIETYYSMPFRFTGWTRTPSLCHSSLASSYD